MNQQNSDGSDQGIEMYPDSWQTIREYARDVFSLFGIFCAALLAAYFALRAFV